MDNISSQIKKTLSLKLPEIKNNCHYISVSLSTGHDLSVTVSKGFDILEVIELERFINDKNTPLGRITVTEQARIADNQSLYNIHKEKIIAALYELKDYIARHYTEVFEAGVYIESPYHYLLSRIKYPQQTKIDIRNIFNANQWFLISHHLAHAAGAFYQSQFNKSLVVSLDGGSKDGVLNVFLFDNDEIKHIANIDTTLCDYYSQLGFLFKDIKVPKKLDRIQTVYPGKIMGLSSYGNPDKIYTRLFKKYLHCRDDNTTRADVEKSFLRQGVNIHFCRTRYRYQKEFRENQAKKYGIEGSEAFIFAASIQKAFEEVYFDLIGPYFDQYTDYPICLTGGGALNILTNTRVYKQYGKLPFVPPDPNDCGLSLGGLLFLIKPKKRYEIPYSGPKLLDRDLLSTYLYEETFEYNYPNYTVKNIENDIALLATLIKTGNIIGVARGRSERGPRALGNRSILASATISGMKDKINHNIKGREWFRPFAPVVRYEDVNTYFEWDQESRYMSFCPLVRKEYQTVLEPITHIDGTARIQTVTRDQNQFIYDLLTEFKKQNDIGVMVNTSFNVDSKPIVSSVKDCFRVLKNTDMNGILIDNVLIMKQ